MTERDDGVDWSALFHAEGSAADTPLHLRALADDDARAHVEGYSHLWSLVRGLDGRAWPATAPAARLVLGLLDDLSLWPDDPTMHDALLIWLHRFGALADLGDRAPAIRARVADRWTELREWTTAYLSVDSDAVVRTCMWEDGTGLGALVLEQATLACFDAVPEILVRTLPHLDSPRAHRRACAAAAVGALAQHPSLSPQRPALVDRLVSTARSAESPWALATIMIATGRLHGDTSPWLTHANMGVRSCAALAPELATDKRATEILLDWTRSPQAFDASFGDSASPPQLQHQDLLSQALEQRAGQT